MESVLFYVDSPLDGVKKIYKSLLDGSDIKVILDKGLSDPHGLSFDSGHLYVTDSVERNGTDSAQLMMYDVQLDEWTPFKLSNNVSVS